MPLPFFEDILQQLRPYTRRIALHVMGDPLTLSNLQDYLGIAKKQGFEVELTTSGYYLQKHKSATLFHSAVRQLNISLNSFNKNSLSLQFDTYMDAIFYHCSQKLAHYPKPFINLRLWNLDALASETAYNKIVFEKPNAFFGSSLDEATIYEEKPASIRLASKVLILFFVSSLITSLLGITITTAAVHLR